MKKLIISSLAVAALAVSGIAFAQAISTTNASTTPNQPGLGERRPLPPQMRREEQEGRKDVRENMRGATSTDRNMKERGDEMRNATSTQTRLESQKRMEEQKKKFEEKRKKAGLERANQTIKRLDRQVADMDKLAKRITDRLAILKTKGSDVSASTAKLAEARTAIDAAKVKVTAVTAALQAAIATGSTPTATSTEMKDLVKTIAPQVRDAEAAIRAADKSLRETMKVRIPRPTTVPVPPTATTTSSTGTTTTQ